MSRRAGRLHEWVAVLQGKEARFLAAFHSHQDRILLLALLVIALALRWHLYTYASPAYVQLEGWLAGEGSPGSQVIPTLEALLTVFSPAYLSLLLGLDGLLERLVEVNPVRLATVKLTPVVLEMICAVYLFRMVRLRYPSGPAPVYAVLGLAFAPTVVMSGAFLGQTDILPVTCQAAWLYYLLASHAGRAWIVFGLAVAIQPQALFLAPLLAAWLWRGRWEEKTLGVAPARPQQWETRLRGYVPWLGLLLIPVLYLAARLPLWWLAGGQIPLSRLLLYPLEGLSEVAYPTVSIYAWASPEIPGVFSLLGLCFGLAALVLLTLAAAEDDLVFNRERAVLLAVASLLTGLYLFPGTQAGDFLPVDVLSIALALYIPGLFYVPFLMAFVSTHARLAELFDFEIIPLLYLSFIPLVLILILVRRWSSTGPGPAEQRQVTEDLPERKDGA